MKTVQAGIFFFIVGAAAVIGQPGFAQTYVNSGLGLQIEKPRGTFNLGLWRRGAPPTGVLAREFGTTLTNLAPYVAPVLQTLTGMPPASLLNPTGEGNESADRDACADIEVVDNDPNLEKRGEVLVAIQARQQDLFKKLGVKDYEPSLKPPANLGLTNGEGVDGGAVGNGLTDPLDDGSP